MAAPRPRGERFAIGFMIVWIVFWMAGILILLFGFVRALLGGNGVPALFLAAALAAAGFGLVQGIRKLKELLTTGEDRNRPARNHEWHDEMEDQGGNGPSD